MTARLVALALLVVPAAALALDRWLGARRGPNPPLAMDMLAVVDAPIADTWAVVADIPRQPEWMHDMKRVTIETPGPVRPGTRAEATVRILGIAVSDPVEIVELEPPRRFAVQHDSPYTSASSPPITSSTRDQANPDRFMTLTRCPARIDCAPSASSPYGV